MSTSCGSPRSSSSCRRARRHSARRFVAKGSSASPAASCTPEHPGSWPASGGCRIAPPRSSWPSSIGASCGRDSPPRPRSGPRSRDFGTEGSGPTPTTGRPSLCRENGRSVSLRGVRRNRLPPPAQAADCGPQALARRLRAGDPPAEDELVRRYQRGVGAVLRRAGADAATAEDLSQETFAMSLRKIRAGEIREPERLAGFLCSLARNLAIEHFRKAGSRRTAGLPDADFASAAPSPLDDLLKIERAAVVRRVLAELPSERDRQVLFRFYLGEEEKDRICRDLGLSSLHFNRVVFRARERYREIYLERTKTAGGPR